MDYEQLKALINNEIEPYLQYIEMWQCIMALGKDVDELREESKLLKERIKGE